jgi:pimeloyl-ACP methyl ester carboxylesterase
VSAARVAAALLAALLLGGCGGSEETTTQPLLAPTATAEAPAAPAPPPATEPAETAETGTPPLHHACEGEGSPTVILEAGLGSPSEGWQDLQRELSALTRTCRYDRAGLGRSPAPDPGPRTAAEHVEELRRLLEAEGIEGPYVLVGHSYGGMLARLFAHTHADVAAGAVLLDSPHADESRRYLEELPPDDHPVLNRLREQLRALHDPATTPEGLDWEASMDEVRAVSGLGDLPLVVVTAGRGGPRAVQGLPEELVEPLDELRIDLQRELAGLSTNSLHVVATGSGHSVPDPQTGEPEVIVAAVAEVVRAVRENRPLRPCEQVFGGRTRCVAAR